MTPTINRYDCVNPISSRYLPEDSELQNKITEYASLDILTKLERIVPEIVVPRLCSLELKLTNIATENNNKQICQRIDGKHKGVITIGMVFKGYAQRLKKRTSDIKRLNLDFKGSERNDRISDLTYFLISAFSVEANIANDIRHLFRSEIEELTHQDSLSKQSKRVGSSTMPHKVNPADYEKVVSFWKKYIPNLTSAVLSQLIEHQGNSTNEEIPFHVLELSCGLSYITKSLEDSLNNLRINI